MELEALKNSLAKVDLPQFITSIRRAREDMSKSLDDLKAVLQGLIPPGD